MSKSMLHDTIKTLRSARADLAQVYGVSNLGVFGSIVRDEAGPNSDIDILVEYTEPPTLFEFVRLQRHLSELLGEPVDLVMKSALKSRIGQQVLVELVPV